MFGAGILDVNGSMICDFTVTRLYMTFAYKFAGLRHVSLEHHSPVSLLSPVT